MTLRTVHLGEGFRKKHGGDCNHIKFLPANDSNKPQVCETKASVLNRLTRDIAMILLEEQSRRMQAIAKSTNITLPDNAYCNVRAASQLFLSSLQMIECNQTRRRVIEEFDMLSNEFLK